jgi:hypothetical protein
MLRDLVQRMRHISADQEELAQCALNGALLTLQMSEAAV